MDSKKSCQHCGKVLGPQAIEGLCPDCLMKVGLGIGTEASDAPSQSKRPFIPPTLDELANRFPQFEILAFIGQGGMGAVYKVRQRQLDRVVALKILPPGVGEDSAFADRFAREARAMARLNHPGIVTIYDFGQADGLYYFIMELVDGVSLRLLMHNGRVSPREALAIVPQICDALQYAHDQGIVHRDIKPENILLNRQGRLKVADFGLAKLVGAPNEAVTGQMTTRSSVLTAAGKVMGTPHYMAPEQVAHPAEVDHRADIYALGVVFYQMLTGELPPKPMQPPSRKVQIDVRLDEVVLQALEKEPERRYQQASQVKTAIETIAAATPHPAGERGIPQTALPGSRNAERFQPPWWSVFVAGFLTVLLLEFGALALLKPEPSGRLLALLAGGVALIIFLLARKRLLKVFLAGLAVAFFLWLGVAGATTGALPLSAAALVIAVTLVATLVFARKKLRSSLGSLRQNLALSHGFLPCFVIVFLVVFGSSWLINFILPESFSSTARIKIERGQTNIRGMAEQPFTASYDPYLIQTEFEVIQSEVILDKVVQDLDLNKEWGKKFANGEMLKTMETLSLLKSRIDLRPVRNTSLIEIRVYSDRPDEAATIANKIAQAYTGHRNEQSVSGKPGSSSVHVEITDRAVPGLRPVRPNKPLNLAIGALAGLLLGTAAGAAVVRFSLRKKRHPIQD